MIRRPGRDVSNQRDVQPAARVAAFAELVRGSQWARHPNLADIATHADRLADGVLGDDAAWSRRAAGLAE